MSSTFLDNAAAGQGTQATMLEVFNGSGATAHMELANVTIAKNQVAGRFGVVSDESAVQTPLALTLMLANSIVLGNQPGDPGQTCLITGTHASITSAGYILLDGGGARSSLQRQPSDGIGTLDADGGNPAGCFFQGAAIQTDQRGLPRARGRCDIGAFEQQP